MKKSRLITVIALMFTMLFAFVGCGAAEEVGEYKLAKMEMEGLSIEASMLEEYGFSADDFSLTFNEDGTGSIKAMDEEEEKFEWEDGKMTADGEEVSYTYEDGKVTLEEDGTKMIFEKK